MSGRFKNFGLISLGVIAGVLATMQFSAIAQKSAQSTLPLEELRQLSDVFGLIKSDYVEPVEDKKLISEAISGMVASLDPHSAYLDKKSFKELRESTQGKFVGLGIEVGMEDGFVKVVSPIEGSPAYRAGLQPNDLITKLDDTPVKGMTLDEAVKRMRGEPNTKITILVFRKAENRSFPVTIIREEIKVQSVKAKIIEPGYGWLRISQFQDPTVEDMARKIEELYKQDPNLKGLVLDLRNDPGGVLPGAIGVSAAFLPKDVVVVSTNGQLPDSKSAFLAKPEFYARRNNEDPIKRLPAAIKTVPLIVLVNTGSASASEIVAGALQDHKRATILGTQTFGKGSVQTIRPLPPNNDTAVKLTTARYYTPSGKSIQAKGITPDLIVEETAEGDGFNALRVREADLDKHLSNKDGEEQKDPAREAARKKLEEELAAKKDAPKLLEFGSKEDYQLLQALNSLKGLPVKVSPPKTETAKVDNIENKPAAKK
ncbi:S41 family peptidase [Ampullimonas aquatilis]|uniref:S41 family peptidase n=1 Tax=Ampullimonas aquatilis TaxID=1341549 RepID=UPI003C747A0E